MAGFAIPRSEIFQRRRKHRFSPWTRKGNRSAGKSRNQESVSCSDRHIRFRQIIAGRCRSDSVSARTKLKLPTGSGYDSHPAVPLRTPFTNLAGAMEHQLDDFRESSAEVAKQLRARGNISDITEKLLSNQPKTAKFLLFIDQFEELFTLARKRLRPKFIAMLKNAVNEDRLRLVLTLRADFYHYCAEDPTLAQLLRNNANFPLAAPELPAHLWQMITGPAAAAGLSFEDNELPVRILEDTGNDPGALALMAFALEQLYLLHDQELLTHTGYESFGGRQRRDCETRGRCF